MAAGEEPLDIQQKVLKYEEFVNEKLRGDLFKAIEAREKVCEQLAHYHQLKNVIEQLIKSKMHDKPLRTQVDIGCNFYMQAKVPDPSKIYINIGLGYHLEFTLPEALPYIDKRVKALNKLSDQLAEDSARIKAHIKLVLEGLRELQNISAAPESERHRPVW